VFTKICGITSATDATVAVEAGVDAIRRVRPWGVEFEPGRKDPAALARFLAEVRAAG
jgi:phosphoribosylanthranilate isomerase